MASDKDSAVNGPQGDTPYASVTVSYILSDGVMDVKVNCGDIKVSDGYALEKINLLSYFGAERIFRRRLHSFTRRQRFAYDVGQQIRLSGKKL